MRDSLFTKTQLSERNKMLKFLSRTLKCAKTLENCAKTHQTHCRPVSQFKRSPILKFYGRNANVVNEILGAAATSLNIEQWRDLRSEILQADRTVNQVNIDAIIMGQLELTKAKSYIDYLKHDGLEINLATQGRILRLYYTEFEQNGCLPEEDIRTVVEIADKIRSESDDHAAATCESLILAICMTDNWKESFKYLDMIRLSCRPSTQVYSAITKAAFDHGDSETGWQLMEQVVHEEKFPKCLAYLAWIDLCQRDRTICLDNLNKMLEFVEANNIILSERVATRLESLFKEFDYNCGRSTISPTYQCTCCKRPLNPLVISSEDFYRVRDSFLEKVLVRKDVFQKSSPVEVERFLAFLDKNARPYDIIIDGLNVAYSAGTQKPAHVYSKLLSSVVDHFARKDKNVLVLGRKHMNNWPKNHMTYIKQSATLFLTENLSHDDPFLLYATLKSGPNACFLSRDLMRSHAYLMGRELKPIFRRWQQARQYALIYAGNDGKIKLKAPTRHQMSAQRCGHSWHIPYSNEINANPASTFEMAESWLCAVATE